MPREPNRYARIIEQIFQSHYQEGAREVAFEREDIERAAATLGIKLPKNLGDVIYSFRYRVDLPEWIQSKAPAGEGWIIRPAGKARYRFVASTTLTIVPNALLAKVRYNRLIDIFTGVACYSLQSHLRTQVPGVGQVETDEVYIGLDRRGAQYVLPVQAKGKSDKLSIVQIEQDFAMCASKFPTLICQPIGAQLIAEDLIALFRFEEGQQGMVVETERHYRLVPPEEVTPMDLKAYRTRSLQG